MPAPVFAVFRATLLRDRLVGPLRRNPPPLFSPFGTLGVVTRTAHNGAGSRALFDVAFWGPAALDLMIDGYTLAKDAKIRIIARAEVGIVARRIGAFAAVKDALTA